MSAISRFKIYLKYSAKNRTGTGRSLADTIKALVPFFRHDLSTSECYQVSLYDGIPQNHLPIRDYKRVEKLLNPDAAPIRSHYTTLARSA
jgi:hypothetical protein